MLFNAPTTLSDATRILLDRQIMPTALDTDGIRALDLELRAQSFFSAQTTNEYLLQRYRDLIATLLEPARLKEYTPAFPGDALDRSSYNPTYVRLEIKKFLQGVGYEPAPEDVGTLKDLSSDARINLVIKTNVDLAQGQGAWMQSQNKAVLDSFPADELFRLESRQVPRFWLQRWRIAGGQTGDPIGTGWTITLDNRMIALKNHIIWALIGSSALFPDALDVVWPPFAFNSGMWVRDVARMETEKIGLILPGEKVQPKSLKETFVKLAQKFTQNN